MSTTILITGLALGALQLIAGVAIGRWTATPRRALRAAGEDRRRARRLAGELQTLTADLSAQARAQGEQLSRVDERLQSEAASLDADSAEHPLTSLVSGVVREMLRANQSLQERLASAELELEARTAEVAEHLQTAMTDPLTGLPNRRALDDHLNVRADAWRKHQTPFSVVMVDVDHFKQFNDTHGHAAGDQALRSIGAALRGALRHHDVVARYGGEEFAVVLPHTDLSTAHAAVRKTIDAVRSTVVEVHGETIPVTASVGLASVRPSERLESLMRRADQALYAAKQAGRDRAWLHDGHDLSPLEHRVGSTESPPGPGGGLRGISPDLQQACSALSSSMTALLEPETGTHAP
ncbi:putative diguanylate cyclase YedQ [Posidoniimonas corsicana]|uniref:diguanylate cyclase n=1 Tax=Posidoniimonas corsicana TaxID=1938618 RepID=A0A5C5V517_9BACT|nr:GGDEF domain-containing protein [Posidoniimonas corsicana]TWT33628.1 putative diguanylate cyclase YedQ [Posidoniimonas corsicana]